MSQSPKILFIILIFILQHKALNAQNKKLDSLLQLLKKPAQDTNRANTLCRFANLKGPANPDTAIIIYQQALALSGKLNWEKGKALSEAGIGYINKGQRNFEEALLHMGTAAGHCDLLIASSNAPDKQAGTRLKGKILSNMGSIFSDQADYAKAIEYYVRALKLAEQASDRKQACTTLINMGLAHQRQSNYSKAVEYYSKALKIAEEFNEKRTIGIISGNMGGIYYNQSDYPRSLHYYFRDLKIEEELGDKEGVGIAMSNIANVYNLQGDRQKALDYFFRGLKNSEEAGDNIQIGMTLANIAGVYADQHDFPRALEYFFKGVKISEEAGDKQQVGRAFGSIGATYAFMGDSALKENNAERAKKEFFPKALEYYLKGLKVSEEIGHKQQIGNTLGNIGSLYTILGKYQDAEINLKKALEISESVGAEHDQKSAHQMLFDLYEKTKRSDLALIHYKKFIALRDSIFSAENTKKSMQIEIEHDFEKKKAVAVIEHQKELEKQQALADERGRRQNIITGSVALGLLIVIVFAIFVFRSLRVTRSQKILIEIKSRETEEQKKIVEVKQKEILDSIHYARRIQNASMASHKYIQKNLEKLNPLT